MYYVTVTRRFVVELVFDIAGSTIDGSVMSKVNLLRTLCVLVLIEKTAMTGKWIIMGHS